MIAKFLLTLAMAMVPVIELRGAIPVGIAADLPVWLVFIAAVIGNMIPVPFIYFFARKFLVWGAKQKHIGKVCAFFLNKGERAGQKLVKTTGRGGLFIALLLFVGIPLPGTGAWTGTLGASFLDMGFKSTVLSVCLGVILAGIIMALASTGVFAVFGF